MENLIKTNIQDAQALEQLYKKDKTGFVNAFKSIYEDIQSMPIAQAWNARIQYKQDEMSWGKKNEIKLIIFIAILSGFIAKLPALIGMEYDIYLSRNISFIILPMLTVYFIWKQNGALKTYLIPALIFIASAIYINWLPFNEKSDTILLATLHLPVFLWMILGYAFVNGDVRDNLKRIEFLKFNGNFIVMTGLIFIAGALFSAITIALFELLKIDISKFYFEQIAIWALPGIPMISSFLVQNNPQLVSKISPIIAKLFTPLVSMTLLVFLCTLVYTGKNVYNDRNFLLLFNVLLVIVMAIILFSVTTIQLSKNSRIQIILLITLSLLTIIANAVALSAIGFRLIEFGITPNRLAVLGTNLLMFVHLFFVAATLLKNLKGKTTILGIEKEIALFIPYYAVWAAFITFIMPFLFKLI